MAHKKIDEVFDALKSRIGSYNFTFVFISNYYLSRKLKDMEFEQILKKIDDENIEYNLKAVYEGHDNYLEYFDNLNDLTLDEIIDVIAKISEYVGRSGGGENTTDTSIIDLSLELLGLEKKDMLLDVGSGIGTTLLKASKLSSISGIEIEPQNYFLSYLLLDLFGQPIENILHKDAFTYGLSKFNANKIFMNMPMGLRIYEKKFEDVLKLKFDKSVYKNIIKSIDSSWIFALDVIENTDYEKFVMVVNGNPLYSDAHQDVRRVLLSQGRVEAVIALPSNLLTYIFAHIPIYLVVFSHNNKNVRFVDARELYSETSSKNTMEKEHIKKIIRSFKKESEISKIVEFEKIEEEDFTLEPQRYTRPEFPFEDSIKLEDVVKSINRGHNTSKKDLEDMTSSQPTDYQYLMLQNFQDGLIDENLPYIKDLDESYEKYLLKDNSIILSRLAPFKIGSVDKLKTRVLANGNLFFLEVDEEKINKDFLVAYLQSRIGLKEIEKYVKGSVMKTINIRDLKKVKIPNIAMEKQIEIGENFVLLNSEFRAIKKRSEEIAKERYNIFEGGI